ncbi:MAG TPA: hypothetical protein VFS54_11585 [Solirubrobacterales bacterium]|nr:hypothetical protein [Solirubrobacterales bacterium]
MTLIEMLVAAVMSVIIVGASCSMLISAVRDQPALSKKAQNVTTARYQLERMVRELRNGVTIEVAKNMNASEVTVVAQVRRVSCGGAVQTNASADAIQCMITYSCSEATCTRTEATMAGVAVGAPTVAASGLGDSEVFCYVPSAEADPTDCGPPPEPKEGEPYVPPTYVGINLDVPNPEGPGLLTISDGATLRSAAFHTSPSPS